MSVWVKASIAQIFALLVVLGVLQHASLPDWEIGGQGFAWVVGLVAAIAGWLIRLPVWWVPIQFLFAPALVFVLALEAPPSLFLAGLITLLLLFPSNPRERVPLYLSNRKTWDCLNDFLPADRSFRMVDLGCGTAGGLGRLAQRLPRGHFVGVESSPVLYAIARLRLMGLPNVQVMFGDLWDVRLDGFDVVYAFLSPSPMPRLSNKLCLEMCEGSIFVSNTFEIPGIPPDDTVEVNDARRTRLLVWRFGPRTASGQPNSRCPTSTS
jgi:SAM-dependent methyltransferase